MSLDHNEQRKQGGGRRQSANHQRLVPSLDPALGDPVDQPGQPDQERHGAEGVEGVILALADQLPEYKRSP